MGGHQNALRATVNRPLGSTRSCCVAGTGSVGWPEIPQEPLGAPPLSDRSRSSFSSARAVEARNHIAPALNSATFDAMSQRSTRLESPLITWNAVSSPSRQKRMSSLCLPT
jgi:hypothetical protein